MSWGLVRSVAGRVISRRSHTSGVVQGVPTTAFGVPGELYPPGPDFHAASSKVGLAQSARGWAKVWRHVWGCFCDGGTNSSICGGVGPGAQFAVLTASRLAHFFQTAPSASILMKTPP